MTPADRAEAERRAQGLKPQVDTGALARSYLSCDLVIPRCDTDYWWQGVST